MESTAHTLVGIDVAKHSLDVYLASEDRCFTIKNSTAGFKQLLDELPAAGSCLVVVEATGGYQQRWLALWCRPVIVWPWSIPARSATSPAAWGSWPRPIGSTRG